MYAFYTLYSLSPVRARAPRCGVALTSLSSISVSQSSGSHSIGIARDARRRRRRVRRATRATRRGTRRRATVSTLDVVDETTDPRPNDTILNTTQHTHTHTHPSMNKLRETQIDARRSGPRATDWRHTQSRHAHNPLDPAAPRRSTHAKYTLTLPPTAYTSLRDRPMRSVQPLFASFRP